MDFPSNENIWDLKKTLPNQNKKPKFWNVSKQNNILCTVAMPVAPILPLPGLNLDLSGHLQMEEGFLSVLVAFVENGKQDASSLHFTHLRSFTGACERGIHWGTCFYVETILAGNWTETTKNLS